MIAQKYTIFAPRILLTLALVLALLWLGQVGWHVFQLRQMTAQAEQLVEAGPKDLDIDQAQGLLYRLNEQLAGLDADLRLVYPLLRISSGFPGVGRYARQVQPLVQYASELGRAGEYTFTALAPFWSGEDLEQSDKQALEKLLKVLVEGEPDLAAASQAIDRATQARQQLEPEILPARLRRIILRVDDSWHVLQASLQLLPIVPELLGEGQPVTYLVLAQNHDELRATGGYISGIGSVQFKDGRLVDFYIDNSYAVDDFSKPYPPPPEPLQRLMLAGYWVARDANWSPDFPTAAQQVQSLYHLSTGRATQGVVAFDQAAVKAIVSVVGPLSLADMPEPVTSENVEVFMRQAWEPDPGMKISGEWWRGRKDFMGILGRAILEKILHLRQPGALVDLGRATLEILESGHLLVYLSQPDAQALLDDANLAHNIEPGDGDFLMLVNSNVGFNKADALVQREVEYEVDLTDPGRPVGKLTVRYTHQADTTVACVHGSSYGVGGSYAELSRRCYWDYWRVYASLESGLLTTDVKPIPGDKLLGGQPWTGMVESYIGEGGSQVFAGVLLLPTRGQESVGLTYSLPSRVLKYGADGELRYRLRLQKQPGIAAIPVQVKVRLPQGYAPAGSVQAWKAAGDSIWVWSAKLDRDQDVELVLLPLGMPSP